MALNIDKELRMPPKAQENERGEVEGSYLPAVLFPVYAKCRKCGLLHNNPWRKQDKRLTENVLCEMCESNLEQLTWCAVSNKGHMSEVPWHYICHKNSETACKADFEVSYLKFNTDTNGKRIVSCTRCHSKNYYENAKTSDGTDKMIYFTNIKSVRIATQKQCSCSTQSTALCHLCTPSQPDNPLHGNLKDKSDNYKKT